jgi:hypothetical protein
VHDEDDGTPDIMYAEPRRLTESVFGAHSIPVSSTSGSLDYFGIGYRNYDRALAMLSRGIVVAEADIDRKTVADAVANTGYETAEPYRGYDVYARSDIPRVVAVSDSALLFGHSRRTNPNRARENVETTIDAKSGEVPRQHEIDAEFAALTRRAGQRAANWLGVGLLDSASPGQTQSTAAKKAVTGAISWDVDADGVYFVYDVVYPKGTEAPKRAIKRHFRSRRRAVESTLTDVETDGRFARIELRMRKATIEDESRARGPSPPQITWGVDHDRANETLTFEHEAGDTADARRLSLSGAIGDGRSVDFDRFGTFEPGDRVVVDLRVREGGPHQRIVYTAPDGTPSTTLISYDLSEADGTASAGGDEVTNG